MVPFFGSQREHALLQEIMGVLIGSAVVPIALCLMWKKTNKWGAMGGAVLGQWAGLVSWLIFAKVRSTLRFAKSKPQFSVCQFALHPSYTF